MSLLSTLLTSNRPCAMYPYRGESGSALKSPTSIACGSTPPRREDRRIASTRSMNTLSCPSLRSPRRGLNSRWTHPTTTGVGVASCMP